MIIFLFILAGIGGCLLVGAIGSAAVHGGFQKGDSSIYCAAIGFIMILFGLGAPLVMLS